MYEKLKQQILPELIPPHSRILIAISGGPDSVALGHILWRYAREEDKNISLVLTHVHHGVRLESDEEEKMVVRLARDWGIPCLVHHFDAKSYAKLSGQSFQTAAREWRYARWKEDSEKEGCNLLATAHHLGDQAETVLYRMLRGSGTAGLAGIYPLKRGVIRPLLSVSKTEILNYCQKEKLTFALDYSNKDPVYVRNKIRLELLPELERSYNPRVQDALGRMAEVLRWDEEYLSGEADRLWESCVLYGTPGQIGLNRDVFRLAKAILSRLIRKVVVEVTGEPRGIGHAFVGQIMGSEGRVGWSQNLPGVTVYIDYDGIWFTRTEEMCTRDTTFLDKGVVLGEWVPWRDSLGQKWKIGLFGSESINSFEEAESNTESVGVERVLFCRRELLQDLEFLRWRNRLPGDKMWFNGLGHKSLKKVFQEEGIGKAVRQEIPLLAFGEEVLWIPGVRVSERYKALTEENVVGLFSPMV